VQPDWDGLLLAPVAAGLAEAMTACATLQSRNGGNLRIGAKLGNHLRAAGFKELRMLARYECYPALDFIGEYLALQLERENDAASAAIFRSGSRSDGGMFAQAWVSVTAKKD